MNTKLLMMSSAVLMAAAGVLLQFASREILRYFGDSSNGIASLLIQLTGALYLGFAMMNWMAKTVLIGGIYARPLAIGNFSHFLIGALALLKFAFAAPHSRLIWIAALAYSILAVLFGVVLFTHPFKTNEPARS